MPPGEPIGGGGGEAASENTGPPISEELIERARAEEAEAKCDALEARLRESESQLAEARLALDSAERRREIERQLAEAQAVDIETASLLTEVAIEQMDEPDIAVAVGELRRRKPFLFCEAKPARAGVSMAAHVEQPAGAGLESLADEARVSGDRRVLLRYLRQRRGV